MTDSNEQDKAPETGQSPSPGARLRAARERKGLSLVEAADALRLDQSLVEALERDDFAALGAPVFGKGHLRKYAVLTGEPVALAVLRSGRAIVGSLITVHDEGVICRARVVNPPFFDPSGDRMRG